MEPSTTIKVSVFMATSLDGFIARSDGDIAWEHPDQVVNHAHAQGLTVIARLGLTLDDFDTIELNEAFAVQVIYCRDKLGIDNEKLDYVMDLKNNRRGRIKEYVERYPSATYLEDQRPWSVPCDVALPCATENEISGEEAKQLLTNGVWVVAEGANMPTEPDAIHLLMENGVLFGPGKAANAGGVATSGLEMSQNSMRLSWSREELDERLRGIMTNIHEQCVEYGNHNGNVDYVKGANIAGFVKVADAMLAYGIM